MDPQTQSALHQLTASLPGDSEVFWYGAIASLLAGLGTSVGALAVFLLRRPSHRTLVGLISGAAGVMLAATFFSLLEPAIEHAEARASHPGFGVAIVLVGVSLLAIGYDKPLAFAVASLTGLVEPIGGAIGAAAVWLAEPAIPVILGIAAGAMLFIISDEIIARRLDTPKINLWALFPTGRRASAKARAFVAFVEILLRERR